ncbi:MAG: regulator of sigma E protease [Oleiphilaceae bacterium]|jgi:regulator of sigma E protease
MMDVIQPILSLILTLGILVTIHEFGHYWVARKCGVKVLRFSVGFGKPLYTWTNKAGTEFVIASIPLGGYVKMLDEREGAVAPEELSQAFNQKTVSQRIAIASAGPIANFMFAIFAYWMMFLSGFNVLIPTIGSVEEGSIADRAGLRAGYEIVSVDQTETLGWHSVSMNLINRIGDTGQIKVMASPAPGINEQLFVLDVQDWMINKEPRELISDLGITPYKPEIPAILGRVLEDSPAYRGGLKAGDKIISAGGQRIDTWFDLVDVIKVSPEKNIQIEVLRTSENLEIVMQFDLTPSLHHDDQGKAVGKLGIGVAAFSYPDAMIRNVNYGPLDSVIEASIRVWSDTKMTLIAIKKMILGLISLDNLSGPITIAQVASDSISSGSEAFLSFLALLSISLGVLNLLPIPVLDGGHILFYVIEGLKGKPLAEKWQMLGIKVGISFVLVLMSLAFYNDVMRLQ